MNKEQKAAFDAWMKQPWAKDLTERQKLEKAFEAGIKLAPAEKPARMLNLIAKLMNPGILITTLDYNYIQLEYQHEDLMPKLSMADMMQLVSSYDVKRHEIRGLGSMYQYMAGGTMKLTFTSPLSNTEYNILKAFATGR
jgi:hypothetical protein